VNSPRSLTAAAGLAILMMASGLASAQVERRGGEENGVLLQQIQELTSERASLQADNTRMKKQLDDLTKERDALKSAQKAVDQRVRDNMAALAQSGAQRAADEKDLALYKQRMDELVAKFRETINTLRQTEIERATIRRSLETRARELSVCENHNAALFKLNAQVLTRWEKQSFWSRLARTDPFTRLAQTRLENLTDDYRSQAAEQRVTSESLRAAAAAAPPERPTPSPSAPASQNPAAPAVSSPAAGGQSRTNSAHKATPAPGPSSGGEP